MANELNKADADRQAPAAADHPEIIADEQLDAVAGGLLTADNSPDTGGSGPTTKTRRR